MTHKCQATTFIFYHFAGHSNLISTSRFLFRYSCWNTSIQKKMNFPLPKSVYRCSSSSVWLDKIVFKRKTPWYKMYIVSWFDTVEIFCKQNKFNELNSNLEHIEVHRFDLLTCHSIFTQYFFLSNLLLASIKAFSNFGFSHSFIYLRPNRSVPRSLKRCQSSSAEKSTKPHFEVSAK